MQISRHPLMRRTKVVHRGLQRRFARLSPTMRGLWWSMAAGLTFVVLNTLMRGLAIQLDPFQTQFLRYLFGLLVMLPLVARAGWATYKPQSLRGQFARGAVHTLGLYLWFAAIPHIPLADTTAIGFTGPIFVMLGAWLVFKEPMRWERWAASLIGLAGVLVVVGPKLSATGGLYTLVMLASAPVFAASFLITKALTRYERAEVIVVWQSVAIAALSLPLALVSWKWPTAWQWFLFAICGVLGSAAHYCLTRSFAVADISATQSVKFLDLVWAAVLGWLVFADIPSTTTITGGVIICASTLWIARRESKSAARLVA
ncbi:MAG: DMT family transporter [Burkholderiaceae bacterium]